MSAKSAALPRETTGATAAGPMNRSGSFAAHLKSLARTIPLHGRYENFIGGRWVEPTLTTFPPPPARSSAR